MGSEKIVWLLTFEDRLSLFNIRESEFDNIGQKLEYTFPRPVGYFAGSVNAIHLIDYTEGQ